MCGAQSSTPSPEKRRVGLRLTIEATFDEEMDKNTLTADNVELYKSGAGTPVGVTMTVGLDGRSRRTVGHAQVVEQDEGGKVVLRRTLEGLVRDHRPGRQSPIR